MLHANQAVNSAKTAAKAETQAAEAENKAVYLSKKLLVILRSALKQRMGNTNVLASDRDLVDFVVQETAKVLIHEPIYAVLVPGKDDRYKYFDSDVLRTLSGIKEIRDKGRFIDACIIAYVYGEEGMSRWCAPSKVIYPQKLGQGKLDRIAKKAAEIAASKSVDSVFQPLTLPLDQE